MSILSLVYSSILNLQHKQIVLLFFLLWQVYLTKVIKNITTRKTFNAIASLSIEVDSQSDEWVKANVKLQLDNDKDNDPFDTEKAVEGAEYYHHPESCY